MRTLEHELEAFQKFGIHLGLERIQYLLEKLDNPHLRYKSIHVAGTNGKGSVCAMLSSILKEAGYKVGMYTSPHLFKYNERIKINGEDISDKDLLKHFKLIKKIAKEARLSVSGSGAPTIFEILTAMAFKYFADKKVDIAVVEVGMGGRFDATNVLIPDVSVITNIDYDHCEYLGKTLSKIANEKAGIIKAGVPVVTAERKKEALDVIKKICNENGSRLHGNLRIPGEVSGSACALIGPHQKLNAAVVVKTLELLRDFKVTKRQIKAGLRKTKWPGRFQLIPNSRFPVPIIVDGAHNPAGVRALKVTIKELKIKTPLALIVGVQKYKDVDSIVKELSALAKIVIVTRSSHPQAMPVNILVAKFRKYSRNILLADNSQDALKLAKDGPVLVCGSIFLAAEILRGLTPNLL